MTEILCHECGHEAPTAEPTEAEVRRMAVAIHEALYDERRLTWGQARAAARAAAEARR